jgi:transaldolase
LIGPGTINTLPMTTLDAYRDHGKPELRLEYNLESAQLVFSHLRTLGIDIDAITQQLETEGLKKFNGPFDELLRSLATRGGMQAATETQRSIFHHRAITGVAEKL